jgi:hypothetical protein
MQLLTQTTAFFEHFLHAFSAGINGWVSSVHHLKFKYILLNRPKD